MLYDLRQSDVRVRWLVTLLLATFGASYLFGAWMVGLYAGFGTNAVAQTFGSAGEAPMAMQMPPDTTVVTERPVSMSEMGEEQHHVDMNLLVQDTHVHLPMYALLAAALSVIALLFAAPWLDFAGMWLTKIASPRFAIVTLAGGWAMALGYTIVAALAMWQMWLGRRSHP